MRIKRRHLVWGGAAVGAAALGWLAFRERPLEVETAVVRRGALQVTVDAEGKTRVRERYVLTAPVAGRLARIELDEGEHVVAGDVLARIAPLPLDARAVREAEAAVAAAEALARAAGGAVRQVRAALDQERRASERAQRLAAAGGLSAREREEAELRVRLREDELKSATARARAAAADVDRARSALVAAGGGSARAAVLVRAPAAGCVLRIPERSERVVAPGAPIIELGDPEALELVVDVLSSDASRIEPGARVIVDAWGDGEMLTGRVRRVEPAAFTRVSALGVEEQRVNVVIDVPNAPAALGDGFRVDTHIVVWETKDALVAPVSALIRTGNQWAVFAVEKGRAKLTRVQVGRQSGAEAQVLSGVDAGARLIVFPSDQIVDGIGVRPQ